MRVSCCNLFLHVVRSCVFSCKDRENWKHWVWIRIQRRSSSGVDVSKQLFWHLLVWRCFNGTNVEAGCLRHYSQLFSFVSRANSELRVLVFCSCMFLQCTQTILKTSTILTQGEKPALSSCLWSHEHQSWGALVPAGGHGARGRGLVQKLTETTNAFMHQQPSLALQPESHGQHCWTPGRGERRNEAPVMMSAKEFKTNYM